MKELTVICGCAASYKSKILVPDDYDLNEAFEFAIDHINEIPCEELEYTSGDDSVLDVYFAV